VLLGCADRTCRAKANRTYREKRWGYTVLTITGIYQNGQISLHETVDYVKPTKVIVTFLEEASSTNTNQDKLIVNLYAKGNITFKQAQALLNHDNWQQTAKMLELYGCQLHYDTDDFEADLNNLYLFDQNT